MRSLFSGVAAAMCMVWLWGCASTVPTPKAKTVIVDPPLSRTIPGPTGWTDVSEKALSPDVIYWLLAADKSASLLLKEIQPSPSSGPISTDESIVTLSHLSLRIKLAELGNGLQITQVPAVSDSYPQFAIYSYSEKGLLRRVVVFRKRTRLFELELAQESDTGTFSRHLAAQIAFAMSVLRD